MLSIFSKRGWCPGFAPVFRTLTRERARLKSVHVGQQVLDLLLGHDLPEAFHFCAAELNNVGNAIVIGGQPAEFQILPLEDALHTRPFFPA